MRKKKRLPKKTTFPSARDQKLPFIEHLHELRRRLFWVATSIIGISLIAYFFQQHLVNALLRPTHGQQFIYTSPIGGLDFLFRVCMYLAIIINIPLIVFQALKYVHPLFKDESMKFIYSISIVSGILALAGLIFGYFVGLPAVLHFLLHQFVTPQIHPLLTIQSYISFVMVYLVGSSLLLQVPLIILFINRIKPLKPQQLLHYERWVILGSFIAAGLMNPSLQVFSQLAVAGPIILMYQLGIVMVWYLNRSPYSPKIASLIVHDNEIRAVRLNEARSALFFPSLEPQTEEISLDQPNYQLKDEPGFTYTPGHQIQVQGSVSNDMSSGPYIDIRQS